jgi:hypothetical protein
MSIALKNAHHAYSDNWMCCMFQNSNPKSEPAGLAMSDQASAGD